MRYRRTWGAVLLAVGCLSARAHGASAAAPASPAGVKVAVVVMDTISGLAWSRLNMAAVYAVQFKRSGAEVTMLFDGPAVQWLAIETVNQEPALSTGTTAAPGAWKPAQSDIEQVRKALAAVRALEIPIRASWREADRLGLRDKLKEFVNEAGAAEAADEAPRLMAQGYQILIF